MTEDDSNDEKSGTEVGSCVKGSRIRKAVPPPEDEILLEPLRGILISEVWRSAWKSDLACNGRKCGDTSASRDENGQVDVWH